MFAPAPIQGLPSAWVLLCSPALAPGTEPGTRGAMNAAESLCTRKHRTDKCFSFEHVLCAYAEGTGELITGPLHPPGLCGEPGGHVGPWFSGYQSVCPLLPEAAEGLDPKHVQTGATCLPPSPGPRV